MKKGLLSLLLVTIAIFSLAGCGNNASNDDNKEAIDQENSGESGDTEETSNTKLYSTDNRLVFNANDLYYIVIDFGSDGYATSFKWMYDYGDSATAQLMVSTIEANLKEEDNVKSVTRDGKYVIVDYKEETYKDIEHSTAEAVFNMYQKVEK